MSLQAPHRRAPAAALVGALAAGALVLLAIVAAAPRTAGGAPAATTVPGATSTSAAPATSGASGQPAKRLLVVGDSVLAGLPAGGAVKDLQAALPGWDITVDAKECRSIQGARKACGNEPGTVNGGLEAVEAHGTGFDAVVLQLGTNDAADPASAQTTINSAKAILDQLKPVPHVYWMTIREAGHYAAGYAEFNRLLRELRASYPNLTVVDWAAATKDRPQLFAPDGLHLLNAGAAYAATVIAGAVNGDLDASVATIVPSTTAPPTSEGPPGTNSASPTTAAAKPGSSSSNDNTTNILIGVAVAVVLLGGIVLAVLAGRRRERTHRREERSARVQAELARSAADLEQRHGEEPPVGEEPPADEEPPPDAT